MKRKTKKYKGIKYIAKALANYFPKQYRDNKKLAKDKAREVLATLKKDKKSVKLQNIFSLIRKKRTPNGKKSITPTIPDWLKDLRYYFETIEFPDYISLTTNEVYFVSTISPAGLPAIQGGSLITYEEYFSDYVSYINAMKSLAPEGNTYYENEWLVTCTEPKINPKTKRYESRIISVNLDGEEIDYKFDINNPTLKPTNLVLSGAKGEAETSKVSKEEQKPQAGEISKESKTDLQKDIAKIEAEAKKEDAVAKRLNAEAEKLRQENISRALKLAEQGWSKLEIKEILSKIR